MMFHRRSVLSWLLLLVGEASTAPVGKSAFFDYYGLRNHQRSHQRNGQQQGPEDTNIPPWRGLASTIRIPGDTDEGNFAYAAGGTLLNFSPNGETLVTGHVVADWLGSSKSLVQAISALHVSTFAYAAKLRRWISLGDLTVSGADCSGCITYIFGMDMTSETLAVLQTGFDSDFAPVQSEVQVYWKSRMYQSRPWMTMGAPIRPDNGVAIKSVAISDEASFVPEKVVVALGMGEMDGSSPGMIQVLTAVEDNYDVGAPLVQWVPVGSTIQGNNVLFGQDVKLSQDGSILAVLGAEAVPPEDSDDDASDLDASCFIRVFQYSDEDEDWVQLGQDITRLNDKDELDCKKINLSADGLTIVSGHRSFEDGCSIDPVPNGHVRVWSFDSTTRRWDRKGPDLDIIVPAPNAGQDFFVGLEKQLSADGDRVTLSGFETLPGKDRVYDKKYAFYIATLEWDQGNWTQVMGTVETSPFPNFVMDAEGQKLAVASMTKDFPSGGLVDTYRYKRDGDEEFVDEPFYQLASSIATHYV